MQAIILAAGEGRRLGRITGGKPKALLAFGGMCIINRQIDMLRSSKIKNIVIVGGYNFQAVKEVLKTCKDIRFVFNPFYDVTNVLTSMWFGKEWLTRDYIFLHGDTVFEQDILKKIIRSQGDIALAIDTKKCQREDMKVKIKNRRVTKISKELIPSQADGEFIGIAKITKRVIPVLHNAIDFLIAKKKFTYFFESAIQRVIDRYGTAYNVYPMDISGKFWEEIDFKKDYLRAKKHYNA